MEIKPTPIETTDDYEAAWNEPMGELSTEEVFQREIDQDIYRGFCRDTMASLRARLMSG